ncbi:MAG: hypothetical protein MZV70_00630 [Desulfobacterales bacterium]|nr:hypothetical protein [Desulfobacterales bacterium]
MSEQQKEAVDPGEEDVAESAEELVVVRPPAETMSKQKLPYFIGVSEASAGAKGLSMNLVIIPPGGAAEPHLHLRLRIGHLRHKRDVWKPVMVRA